MFDKFCTAALKRFWQATYWCDDHRKFTLGVVCFLIGASVATAVFAVDIEKDVAIEIECSAKTKTCTVKESDLHILGERYNAAIAEIKKLRARKCQSWQQDT